LPALAAAAVMFGPGPATAQAVPAQQSDSALEAASDRFEAGKRLFREGQREGNTSKLERAYFEFKAAYAIYPGKGTLLNLIETELATGRSLDAMKHLREYERAHGLPDERSEYRAPFQAHWDAAFKATGHIEVQGPASMRVVVDGGDEAWFTPITQPIDVITGHHTLDATGAENLRTEVYAPAGTIVRASLTRAPVPADEAAAPPITTAASESQPQATISRPFFTPRRAWGVTVGGVGALSLVAGGIFAVSANRDANRASALVTALGPSGCASVQGPSCSDLQSAHDEQARDHTLSLVFFGVGGAALLSGMALILWPESATKIALAPLVSVHGGGVWLGGQL